MQWSMGVIEVIVVENACRELDAPALLLSFSSDFSLKHVSVFIYFSE